MASLNVTRDSSGSWPDEQNGRHPRAPARTSPVTHELRMIASDLERDASMGRGPSASQWIADERPNRAMNRRARATTGPTGATDRATMAACDYMRAFDRCASWPPQRRARQWLAR